MTESAPPSPRPMGPGRRGVLFFMAFSMVGIGVAHFVRPAPFVDIVPAYLPAPLMLVYISGLFEILGGLGLLPRSTRRMAAWGLVALYVAVFPANINMALNEVVPTGTPALPVWALWGRLPLQGLLIWLAYSFTKD